MADTRYSREDYADAVSQIGAILDHTDTGSLAYVDTLRLKLWRALLSEAANRAPTHAELSDRLRMLNSYEATEATAAQRMTPTPEPGAPQQDGPTTRPSAPAEGASGDRGST